MSCLLHCYGTPPDPLTVGCLPVGASKGLINYFPIIHCTNELFTALENVKEVCAVFFDLRKAFDSVPHVPLLTELYSLGLNRHFIYFATDEFHYKPQFCV